ncbi:acyl-CoA ligase (AMP-forming), exosortase A system-associated [Aquisalimonas lutea]|uniref:acyl-CoA ligase (AMP-forming), exosortase A system-associated n=1 Tax=Aquisalimonas lutea TaxID=1327750 RepID=UPI0025B42DAD|nr:acyl-CoA ligase (AMP-forming), exosortase A system-associated [Aquisalimonas lutea]MDN3517216.1 acyl-CoA ligase (AMP-forming), exosortase A system-associated [Aquisalimonas lutea]
MTTLFHDIPSRAAQWQPDTVALRSRHSAMTFAALDEAVRRVAAGLYHRGLRAGQRVVVYLDKRPETVAALFAITRAGAIAVPANPALKPRQVAHLLGDSAARGLITSRQRLQLLREAEALAGSHLHPTLTTAVDDATDGWSGLQDDAASAALPRRVESDPALILYTSGSTGLPKGVVLSHRNLIAGVESVVEYLDITADDHLVGALPLSFDYGLNQITTALYAGGRVYLYDYLWPRELLHVIADEHITGFAAVPPLWNQLVQEDWPETVGRRLRYITNSGGKLPAATLQRLQAVLPTTQIFLMYGLTEAFRSTYLPPQELSRRPDSMGQPIPNARIHVVRPDGTPCEAGETGELVHAGPLVALGYWNDPERTRERFRPAPDQPLELPQAQTAVWSGDLVVRDEAGYLYFRGRRDEMIKSSGYRISPTEIEEVLHDAGLVSEVAVIGVTHPVLGEGIVAVVVPRPDVDETTLRLVCQKNLPRYMVPGAIVVQATALPRGPNGKIDRAGLRERYQGHFDGEH